MCCMVISYFKKFFGYFKEEKKAFATYSILSIIAGILELTGVALTYPFVLNLLSEEEAKHALSPYLLGLIIITLFLIKNLFMILYTYIQTGYTRHLEIILKKKFMAYFLGESFEKTSKIPLSYKNKMFTLFVNTTVYDFILRLLNFNINFIIFILITIFIAIKFPTATLIAVIFSAGLIIVQNKIYKPFLKKIGLQISETTNAENRSFNDAILNIKEIKISNNEKYFYEQYLQNINKRYNYSRKWNFLNAVPPYVTEPCVIMLLFLMLVVITIQTNAEPDKLLASVALIASAIFRLTPSISRMQVNLNGINAAMPIVKEFLNKYEELNLDKVREFKNKDFENFNYSIELNNITFGYNPEKPVIKNMNLKINKGEFIGIAGISGAGKTTLIDLLAGIYKPNSGCIYADGEKCIKPLKIGYIQQDFKLINASIADNVAFGHPEFNENRIIEALKDASLYNFIVTNFENGIYENPFVDANGFSQGQKQRLAIARALYSEPDILILDEATSSLDLETESEICAKLNELKGEKTIIVIAHRISTIKSADRIIFLENGQITGNAPYEELISQNAEFKKLAELAVKE